jgi:hypothetical protein
LYPKYQSPEFSKDEKGKVRVHYAMKTSLGVEVSGHSRPCRFTSVKYSPVPIKYQSQSLAPAGNITQAVQPVSGRDTD